MSALISVLLLASISTPAHANGAPSTVNCSVSGTFTITSGVVSAGNSCAGSAVVPADVTSIGEDAFAGAAALTSIAFDGTSSLTSIGNAAFFNARALTSITIPASVTSIGDYAFQDAISLVSVYFLGNAPATIGTTPFLNTAAGAKALIRSGATGFTTSGTPALWNGLAVEVVADTPAPAPAPVPTPKLATTGPSEQIALGAIASSSIFMLLTGAMLLIRRRELS
jgi:hypothetical protein